MVLNAVSEIKKRKSESEVIIVTAEGTLTPPNVARFTMSAVTGANEVDGVGLDMVQFVGGVLIATFYAGPLTKQSGRNVACNDNGYWKQILF